MNLFKKTPEASPLTRLRLAVKASDTESVREILAANPDLLTYRDEKGRTALHWASEAQDLSVVAALVDLGADVTAKDNLGYTPRDVAYWFGEFHMGAYTDVCKKIVQRLNEPPHKAYKTAEANAPPKGDLGESSADSGEKRPSRS